MRIPRIYLPKALNTGDTVELDERAARHAVKVLRLRPGDALVLFNGEGGEFDATLEGGPREAPRVQVREHRAGGVESPLQLHLAQAVARGERMDFVIQKAVELGVNVITPLMAERCVVRLDGERRARRVAHWQGVAISAAEQCGRDRIPTIEEPLEFEAWLGSPWDGPRLVLAPLARRGLRDFGPETSRVRLMIGPEGGLTDSELERACTAGYEAVRLGPRILRTETAAVAALTALQALWGDLCN